MQSRQAIEEALARRLLLGELLARNARKFSDREAVVYGDTRLSYRQFNARINRLAHALLDIGITKGEKVAILLFNCNQILESYFAVAKIGAVAVPLNFRLHPEELQYITHNSDAVAFILGEAFVNTVRGIQKELPKVRHYISVSQQPVEGMLHYESLIQKYPDDEPLVLVEEDDPVFIMYTAGTTGRPKGAVLTHKNQVVILTVAPLEVSREPNIGDMSLWRSCVAPPIFHAAASTFALAYLLFGATVIMPTQVFNPVEVMQIIEREKCDSVLLIPAMLNFLLQLPDLNKYDTSSLKLSFSGAAILPTDLRRRFKEVFPHVGIVDCFGQTESNALVSMLRPSDAERKVASVGKALPFVEIRVVDDDDREVPVGEVGEAIYRGPTMMKEYYNNPEATAEAFRGGWFHSGDLVRRDEEGFLYVVDRKKDMIVSGGENIYPAEVEEVLYKHPRILEAAVIGVHDDVWGESVKAIVVPKPGETLTEEEVIDFCKDHLASYKKPRSVEFIDALPRNPAMKVLKTVLREKYGKAVKY
ncbi:MAG: acyl-CoA synthetase [Dehalococcoidia bacterium]